MSDHLTSDDQQLWRDAARGDADATERLVQRALRVCEGRLRRFRGDDRDDLRQCIAAAVLRALATGAVPRHNLDAMLEWRGRAEITAFVRRMIRERRIEGLDDVLELAGYESAPSEVAAADELQRRMRACVERVPNRDHRDALRHRLLDGWSAAEIATALAAKVELVRVWIARASAQVGECLGLRLRQRGDA
jgi:RNA polymerase sigma factor (sigma-70 family)